MTDENLKIRAKIIKKRTKQRTKKEKKSKREKIDRRRKEGRKERRKIRGKEMVTLTRPTYLLFKFPRVFDRRFGIANNGPRCFRFRTINPNSNVAISGT